MPHSFDAWEIENFQVAKEFGIPIHDLEEWDNARFYDHYEYVLIQQEIDRRVMAASDD